MAVDLTTIFSHYVPHLTTCIKALHVIIDNTHGPYSVARTPWGGAAPLYVPYFDAGYRDTGERDPLVTTASNRTRPAVRYLESFVRTACLRIVCEPQGCVRSVSTRTARRGAFRANKVRTKLGSTLFSQQLAWWW